MNQVANFIKSMEKPNFPFTPSSELYKRTGIRQRRFGMILRNQISPTLVEINAIAKYFGVSINNLISE